MDPLKPGDPERIGPLTTHGRLGRGAMGVVYYGVTPDGTGVAVKVISDALADRTEIRARFDREIDALRMVQGPRVARLVDASPPDAEQPWLAMRYVRGLTLRDYVQAYGPLPAEPTAALGLLLAEGLRDVHLAGLLHRDFKPANIVLGRDGPRVIDFGLVAIVDAPSDLTRSAEALGTPVCMAPEQFQTPRHVTAAIDRYALGAVLTFAATGHYPYEISNLAALHYAVCDPGTAPDLSELAEPLVPLVRALLAVDPDQRPELPDITEELTATLDAAHRSGNAARAGLAELTYVERADDPPGDLRPSEPAPPAPTRPVHIPRPVVARLAAELRVDYARGSAL